MKPIQNAIWALLFTLGFGSTQAQMGTMTYFQYDASAPCMKKYDYQRAGTTFPRIDYYDYHIRISPDMVAIFRVEKLDVYKTVSTTLDKVPLGCDNIADITNAYIKDVNEKRKVAYIVERLADNSYVEYKVDRIVSWIEKDAYLSFEDLRHDFDYTYDKVYNPDEKNLSMEKDAGAKVFLNGNREKLQCVNVRKFRSFSKHPESPFEDLEFLEGIGLYKISASGSELRLMSVNGTPLDQYVGAVCSGNPNPNPTPNPTPNPNPDISQNNPNPDPFNPNPDPNPTPNPTNTGGNDDPRISHGGFGGTNGDIVRVDHKSHTSSGGNKNPNADPFNRPNENPDGTNGGNNSWTGGGNDTGTGGNDSWTGGGNDTGGNDGYTGTDGGNPDADLDGVNGTGEPKCLESSELKKHQVRLGDNLTIIAKRYGRVPEWIMCQNNLSSINTPLRVGDILIVENPNKSCCQAIPKKVEIQAGPDEHKIKFGQKLWDIANMYGTTVETIRCLNNMTEADDKKLQVDQIIKVIDRVGTCGQNKLVREVNNELRMVRYVHVVRKGDTLYTICIDNGLDFLNKGLQPLYDLNPWLMQRSQGMPPGEFPPIDIGERVVVKMHSF